MCVFVTRAEFMVIVVIVILYALSLSIVYRCTPDVRAMMSASGRLLGEATRLQIQHISVFWAGVEQSLFGRKIAMMMMMMVVVTAVVVVFRLAKYGAGAVDGGELGVVGTVGGDTVATLATDAWATAEDASGETASSIL